MLNRFFAFIIRMLLGLRYRTRVHGLETLRGKRGVLILPNHPAEIDPPLVASWIWKYLEVRPVVLEKYYFLPFVHTILKYINSIPIPDMDIEPGPFKRRRVERAMDAVYETLKNGGNVLLYPAGQVKIAGREQLGGTSAVRAILEQCPDLQIVLVRTTGLYGSIFSKALTGGESPDFVRMLLKGIKIVLSNFIFFTPGRDVEVDMVPAPEDFPRRAPTIVLNKWLEDWYNKAGPEEITLVSYKWWKEDLPVVPEVEEEKLDLTVVSPVVVEEVINKVALVSDMPKEKVTLESRLGDDLGLDSLAIAELVGWLNERFAQSDVEMTEVSSVASLVRIASGLRRKIKDGLIVPESWFEDTSRRPGPVYPSGSLIPEAFLKTADRMGKSVALGDQRSGVIKWDRLKVAVLLIAEELRKLPGTYIGVLLPSSVGASMLTMAAMVSGKVPVMLNWTAGRRNVEHAVKICNLEHIISSQAFLDLVDTDLEYVEDKLLLVENLRQKLGLLKKLRAAMLSKKSPGGILSHFGLAHLDGRSPAVVLFTSGSEADPKGVPLSHRNILFDIQAGAELFSFDSHDVLYGFLPPFHSFGLTICSMLPLVSGIKAVCHPNPNESRKIAAGCGKWGVSIIAGTPTFLKGILTSGEKEQFEKLKILIAGAEKAPEELFELARERAPHGEIVEGYGITECAPIVSANRPGRPHDGVGQPLRGVELLIVNHETLEPVAAGERGLILIRGENVFSGYLAGRSDPFVEVQGKRWYNSGDLGFIRNGALHISGRLKRFIKIGGEMLSLAAVEDAVSKEWPPSADEGPSAAVIPVERDDSGRPEIHLFTTRQVNSEDANRVLAREGFPNLVKISKVHSVDAMPLLGSGKTDIQALKRMLQEK